jgi:hypothetical protein
MPKKGRKRKKNTTWDKQQKLLKEKEGEETTFYLKTQTP